MESHAMLRHTVSGVIFALALLCALPARPAFAQAELTGSWAPIQSEYYSNDTVPVDYTALPLNDEGRARALSYSESQLGMIERQCEGWPVFYFLTGPFGLKIWNETEPAKGRVISYTIGAWEDKAAMLIWMDGRPHPSKYAEHTRGGFTTGRWEGSTLVTRTTHMKEGFIRKNGPPNSDQVTMTNYFYRHGDVLTVLAVIEDPIYLAEPLIWTRNFQVSAAELSPVGPPCVTTFEGTTPGNEVPHYLPGKTPYVDELTKKFGIPREAVLGYPETLYPEYRQKIKATPAR
jgi:hypothetical protein